ncbi:MAG: hypothetical protein QM642_05880 [Edaphocola sp.]
MLFPLVAALLGCLANVLLANFIFNKILPQKLPAVAAAAVHYISANILNGESMAQTLVNADQLQKARPFIEGHIDIFLHQKLKEKMPAIAMFVGEKTLAVMKDTLMEEIDNLLPGLIAQFAGNALKPDTVTPLLLAAANRISWPDIAQRISDNMAGQKSKLAWYGAATGLVTGLLLAGLQICFA